MIGSSQNNRENYPRKCFRPQEKETWVKFKTGLSVNQPSNKWAPWGTFKQALAEQHSKCSKFYSLSLTYLQLLGDFKLTTFYTFNHPICAICLPNYMKKISVPMKYTHYSMGKALYDFYSLINKYQKTNGWALQTSEWSNLYIAHICQYHPPSPRNNLTILYFVLRKMW